MKKYTIGEHTADLEMRVWGRDVRELFRHAAEGVLDYIALPAPSGLKVRKEIHLEAPSLEDLFISWLNEILFWLEVKEIKFQRFTIKKLTANQLSAVLEGGAVDLSEGTAGAEIKAATYHDLFIKKIRRGWEAHVILDL